MSEEVDSVFKKFGLPVPKQDESHSDLRIDSILSLIHEDLLDSYIGEDTEIIHDEASEVDAYLEHHGVKGMRWGVRRDRTEHDINWGLRSVNKKYKKSDLSDEGQKEEYLRAVNKVVSKSMAAGNKEFIRLKTDDSGKITGVAKPGEKTGYTMEKSKTKVESTKSESESSSSSKSSVLDKKSLKKNRSSLTDKELTDSINRLKTERELKQLVDADKSSGRQFTENILKTAGTQVLTKAAAGAMTYGVSYAINKKIDSSTKLNASDLKTFTDQQFKAKS